MNKNIKMVILLVIVLVVLTGCSGKGEAEYLDFVSTNNQESIDALELYSFVMGKGISSPNFKRELEVVSSMSIAVSDEMINYKNVPRRYKEYHDLLVQSAKESRKAMELMPIAIAAMDVTMIEKSTSHVQKSIDYLGEAKLVMKKLNK